METNKRIFIILFLMILITGCYTYRFSEKQFFNNKQGIELDSCYVMEYVFYRNTENITLEGIIYFNKDATINVVFFPGISGNLNLYKYLANTLAQKLNANLFIPNYRGYGYSEGIPTMKNLISDTKDQIEYFLNYPKVNRRLPLFIMGHSFGTNIALESAKMENIKGVILIAPFSTNEEVIEHLKKKIVPFYLCPFIRIEPQERLKNIDNYELLRVIDKPVLILHGTDDDELPIWMSEHLVNNLNNNKIELIKISGAGHFDIFINQKHSNLNNS
ncbi:MAG TPA: alpha/beta fold hydrolase [Candidatus Marinimicrobia bacterium]|nr:alpha/beta fold hydrolase [Candidatus Neomarinimicrobiota bacterium]HQE95663.1 alpha/beta fold hydrolase [Candidatus Neomarinimicrobiota bacterium]